MATQVLYRQWRPKRFDEVIGQDTVVRALRNQIISGRISHAYLFCGSRGTGKTTCAKIFARTVNCMSPINGEACGQCDACRKMNSENGMDIVEMDAASNNSVDDIRELIEKINYPPQIGLYRVYIIDEVHMMSGGAFNALLKTLEEPPKHVIFILATTDPQKLPATILSRCQRYDFKRITAQTLRVLLERVCEGENIKAEQGALNLVARAAEGAARDALSLLDMCRSYGQNFISEQLVADILGSAGHSVMLRFSQALIEENAGKAMQEINYAISMGKDPGILIKEITQHFRELMLAQTCSDNLGELLDIPDEDAEDLAKHARNVSRARLLGMLDLFLNAENEMRWVGNPRIALELAAVRACAPDEGVQLEALTARTEALEHKADTLEINTLLQRIAELEKKLEEGVKVQPSVSARAVRGSSIAEKSMQEIAPPPKDEEDLWQRTVDAVRKNNPGMYNPLKSGILLGMDSDVLTVQYKQTDSIFLQIIGKPEKKKIVEECLGSLMGRQITFNPVLEQKSEQTPQGESNQRKAFEMFGRENISVETLEDE